MPTLAEIIWSTATEGVEDKDELQDTWEEAGRSLSLGLILKKISFEIYSMGFSVLQYVKANKMSFFFKKKIQISRSLTS